MRCLLYSYFSWIHAVRKISVYSYSSILISQAVCCSCGIRTTIFWWRSEVDQQPVFSLSSCLQGFWWLHLETWSLIPSILFSFHAKIAVQSVVLKGWAWSFSFSFGYAITFFFLTILVCLLCIRADMVRSPLAQCPLYSHLSVRIKWQFIPLYGNLLKLRRCPLRLHSFGSC